MHLPFLLYEQRGRLTGKVVRIHDRRLDGWQS